MDRSKRNSCRDPHSPVCTMIIKRVGQSDLTYGKSLCPALHKKLTKIKRQ